MSNHASGGSPMANPQRYRTLPITVLSQAEQRDRWLNQSELKEFTNFFSSGMKLLEVAVKLTENADAIVSAGANRIFYGGVPMAYLEPPPYRKDLPGYETFPRKGYEALPRKVVALAQDLNVATPSFSNPFGRFPIRESIGEILGQFSKTRDPLPDGFRRINVSRYGPVRMKRSMRDLSWFLRYVTYAIVAGDSSILSANVRGLRGVIPEDVTEATAVAIQEMQRKSLGYFRNDPEATDIINQHFDVLIVDYKAEKPVVRLRPGTATGQQGLQLPESYVLSAIQRPKFVLTPNLSATEKEAAIKAAYRQVFERDITREFSVALPDLESQVKGGIISTKEFIRQLGKSRVYRREFYEPFVISRVIELAVRHFLGRALSTPEEFQEYFDVISQAGLPALVDVLVDSPEYADYFGEETVPYLRGLGQEAQEFRNWGGQFRLFKFSAQSRKVPQFVTEFGDALKPLPSQHPYGFGNDPLEIQFGAIFPRKDASYFDHPAIFGKDSRRILIRSAPGNGDGANNLGKVPGSLSDRVLKLEPSVHPSGKDGKTLEQGVNVSLLKNSPAALIQGIYRQLFGRDLFANQRLEGAEIKLSNGEITVREFIRQLAKSRLFRRQYWEPLYVTKAIEYIHLRLLGRPTYGRQETSRYYDISCLEGFHALIDALIDSPEYLETFGEDTVPYERYVTPRGFSMRSRNGSGGVGIYAGIVSGSTAKGTRVSDGDWVKDATPRGVQVFPQSFQLKSQSAETQSAKKKAPDLKEVNGAKQRQVEPESEAESQASSKSQTAEVKQPQAEGEDQATPGEEEVKQRES